MTTSQLQKIIQERTDREREIAKLPAYKKARKLLVVLDKLKSHAEKIETELASNKSRQTQIETEIDNMAEAGRLAASDKRAEEFRAEALL